jgi:bifunctional non-homologous end joining protein LigD
MMPTLVDEPPTTDGWIHEVKYDGYRTILAVDGGSTRAFTRNGHDWTGRYLPIVATAAELPCWSALIDGEMVVQDPQGRADFHAMRAALSKEPERLAFFAFDLPMLDGRDLRNEPLHERRRLLQDLVGSADLPQFAFSGEVPGTGPEVFAAADAMGLEGIVSKDLNSPCRSGTSLRWLKTRAFGEAEFHLVGLARDPKGPPVALRARGELEGLRYAGNAIIALSLEDREALRLAADYLQTRKPVVRHTGRQGAQWLKPGLIARVRFRGGSMQLKRTSPHAGPAPGYVTMWHSVRCCHP